MAALHRRMPIQRGNVTATFKSRGGFSDEVSVRLPELSTGPSARGVVDPVRRASEVLGTSYLDAHIHAEGTAGRTSVRTRGGQLVHPPEDNQKTSAVERVFGSGD